MGRPFGDSDSIAMWRKRAASMRAIARTTREMNAKRELLELAIDWEKLADQAEARLGRASSVAKKPAPVPA
jgi:hypothetical protein